MDNLSLFIKPWLSFPVPEIIKKVKELGFKEVEVPIRNGCFLNPDNCIAELPKFHKLLKSEGITIKTVASVVDERIFAAMNEAEIDLMRVMLICADGESYTDGEKRFDDMMKEASGYCEKYNTKVGIQAHVGNYVFSVMELKHLLERCDEKYIGAVWDTGHAGLAGEIPEKSIDIIFDRIMLINLKAAYFLRYEDEAKVKYKPFYTIGEESPCSWQETVNCLNKKGYKGGYCTHAEYTSLINPGKYAENDEAEKFLKEDLNYIGKIL